MNSTFTVNEEVIRRLVLQNERAELGHQRLRQGHVAARFWHHLIDLVHEPVWFVSRAR